MKALIVVLLLLFVHSSLSLANNEFDLYATATGANDNGYTANVVNECVDLSPICIPGLGCVGNLCLTFQLDTCAQMVNINFTRNNDILFARQISNLATQEQCQEGNPCQTCLGFSQVTITPAGATICPRVIVRCPLGINPSTEFNCINIGNECSATTCDDCTSQTNCGWCEGEKRCRPLGRTGPYCGTCTPNDSWWLKCPTAPLADGSNTTSQLSSGAMAGVIIGAIVGALLLVLAISYVVMLQRRIKRASDTRGDVVRLENESSQSHSETNETYVPPS